VPHEPGYLVGQHRLSTDNSFQKRQPPPVLTRLHPLEHEPIDELSRKPDPHPTPNNTVGVLISGNQVVKRPVEMRKGNIDSHPRNRQPLGGTPSLGRRPSPSLTIRHHATIS